MSAKITVQTTINAPIEKVWDFYTLPEHIVNWNNASDDWFTPNATNDLTVGGRFLSRMEAKDGSESFDFEGTYTEIEKHNLIRYKLDDEREVEVNMSQTNSETTEVIVTFDAETENPVEMQQEGWQAILDSFKRYVEGN